MVFDVKLTLGSEIAITNTKRKLAKPHTPCHTLKNRTLPACHTILKRSEYHKRLSGLLLENLKNSSKPHSIRNELNGRLVLSNTVF